MDAVVGRAGSKFGTRGRDRESKITPEWSPAIARDAKRSSPPQEPVREAPLAVAGPPDLQLRLNDDAALAMRSAWLEDGGYPCRSALSDAVARTLHEALTRLNRRAPYSGKLTEKSEKSMVSVVTTKPACEGAPAQLVVAMSGYGNAKKLQNALGEVLRETFGDSDPKAVRRAAIKTLTGDGGFAAVRPGGIGGVHLLNPRADHLRSGEQLLRSHGKTPYAERERQCAEPKALEAAARLGLAVQGMTTFTWADCGTNDDGVNPYVDPRDNPTGIFMVPCATCRLNSTWLQRRNDELRLTAGIGERAVRALRRLIGGEGSGSTAGGGRKETPKPRPRSLSFDHGARLRPVLTPRQMPAASPAAAPAAPSAISSE